MKQTTLCYIENNDAYLMLHRIKKENDLYVFDFESAPFAKRNGSVCLCDQLLVNAAEHL